MRYYVAASGRERVVEIRERSDGSSTVTVSDGAEGAHTFEAEVLARRDDAVTLRIGNRVFDIALFGSTGQYEASVNGRTLSAQVENSAARAAAHAAPAAGNAVVTSPMPGKVLGVRVAAGDAVEPGAPLLVIEAMKMENELMADRAGVIAEVYVSVGASVESGAPLLRID